jgi:hypothetical protein
MDEAEDAEVRWSREGDAWIGVLDGADDPRRAGADRDVAGHDGPEVEVLLRAEDWQVEVSHAACGDFARENLAAADAEEAKAKAAALLRAYARSGVPAPRRTA